MSPAGLLSLARSRRPAQKRPGAPEPGAGRSLAAKEAEHSRSGAWLCIHGFPLFGTPGSLSSQPPPFRAALIISLIPERVTGEDPLLSYHREKAILPLLNTPQAGLGPTLPQQSEPLVRSKGVEVCHQGAGRGGCAAFFVCTVAEQYRYCRWWFCIQK